MYPAKPHVCGSYPIGKGPEFTSDVPWQNHRPFRLRIRLAGAGRLALSALTVVRRCLTRHQQLTQPALGPRQPTHYGADRHVQFAGDILVRQFVEIEHGQISVGADRAARPEPAAAIRDPPPDPQVARSPHCPYPVSKFAADVGLRLRRFFKKQLRNTANSHRSSLLGLANLVDFLLSNQKCLLHQSSASGTLPTSR